MGGLAGFFQAGKIHPPERRLQEAVLKARALAERESIPVFLSYDRQGRWTIYPRRIEQVRVATGREKSDHF